jgi:hypothetical protein
MVAQVRGVITNAGDVILVQLTGEVSTDCERYAELTSKKVVPKTKIEIIHSLDNGRTVK